MLYVYIYIFKHFVIVFLSLFWERVWVGRGKEGGKGRIPSSLRTASAEPNVGLNLLNREIVTCAEIKSWTLNQLSHPGAHVYNSFKVTVNFWVWFYWLCFILIVGHIFFCAHLSFILDILSKRTVGKKQNSGDWSIISVCFVYYLDYLSPVLGLAINIYDWFFSYFS